MMSRLKYEHIRQSVRNLSSAVTYLLKVGVCAHFTFENIGAIVVCQGESMEPTLKTGDLILTDNITPKFGSLKRGDVIVAKSPINPTDYICKRVIGMSGDKVVQNSTSLPFSHNGVRVPRGHIWLEGDNGGVSLDSREYGPVPLGLVKGRVIAKIWPLHSSQIFFNTMTP